MANPSKKSPKMEVEIDLMSHKIFGRARTGSIHGDICVMCGEDASTFRDTLSKKEYSISGACQSCQDKIFG